MKVCSFLLVLWLLMPLHSISGDDVYAGKGQAKIAEATTLRILSWNIHCLPPFAYLNGKRKRALAIGDVLAEENYDLIIFQEAFLHGARRKIEKKMKEYRYRIGPANARYITLRTNSGIWIISKIPVEKVGRIKFSEKATPDDKMARKGALMVEGEKNGHRFQVVGTHLNAGGPIEVRHSQVTQIRNELLLPFQKEGVPQIIGGDMNMRKESDNYPFMLKTYDAEDGPLEVDPAMRTTCYDKKGRLFRDDVIDFIFYRSNGKEPAEISRNVPCYQKTWNKDGDSWLTDHPPMAVEIVFE